ncbi:ycbX [Bugula neritina]|uniref:YcbX n=1 Tax=Bugula neritina TaxID=10212 RepID=A0A7J7JEC9_BUGNE|nr:ycbX [Bugula neritina]
MATTLTVPLGFPNYDPSQVKAVMWFDGSRKKFVEVGEDASDWFSKYLNKEALLVTTHPDLMSEVNPQLTYSEAARVERHKGTRVTFEGTHPYLLISQNSIDDLNTRISEHVTNDSFRGNIVLSGSAELTPLHAYEEEKWKRIRIGAEAMMHTEKPCSRCPTIQIDFEKLELRKNKEPTTTLLRYHRGTRGKDKYTPVFGVNCSLIQEG